MMKLGNYLVQNSTVSDLMLEYVYHQQPLQLMRFALIYSSVAELEQLKQGLMELGYYICCTPKLLKPLTPDRI